MHIEVIIGGVLLDLAFKFVVLALLEKRKINMPLARRHVRPSVPVDPGRWGTPG